MNDEQIYRTDRFEESMHNAITRHKAILEAQKERDRFEAAMAAMQGLLANPTFTETQGIDSRMIAASGVEYADALLYALERTK